MRSGRVMKLLTGMGAILLCGLAINIHWRDVKQRGFPLVNAVAAHTIRGLSKSTDNSKLTASSTSAKVPAPVNVPTSLPPVGSTSNLPVTHQISGPAIPPSPYAGLFNYESPKDSLMGRSYWMGKRTITAVLLRPSATPHPAACQYGDGVTHDITYLTGLGETHTAKVVPVVVVCKFDTDNREPPTDGSAVLLLDKAKVPLYNYRPKLSKPFDWTLCMPCLHLRPRYVWINQWMNYYKQQLGADYFFVYSAIEGQTTAVLRELGVHLAVDHTSVLNIASQNAFKPYYFGQTLAMHDCMFMNRHLGTKWTVFQDFDEILSVPGRFATPFRFFESQAPETTAVTFGTWPVDVITCRPESVVTTAARHWPLLARMHQRHTKPYCGERCSNWQGRRKFALRPDKHERLFIHQPMDGKVVHVPVNTGGDAFLYNYWSIQDMGMHYCEKTEPGPAVVMQR